MTITTKPEKTIRIGSLSASIWARPTKDTGSIYYTVQFQRSYRTKDGTQYTDSFNHEDLLNITEIAQRAEAWIFSQSN